MRKGTASAITSPSTDIGFGNGTKWSQRRDVGARVSYTRSSPLTTSSTIAAFRYRPNWNNTGRSPLTARLLETGATGRSTRRGKKGGTRSYPSRSPETPSPRPGGLWRISPGSRCRRPLRRWQRLGPGYRLGDTPAIDVLDWIVGSRRGLNRALGKSETYRDYLERLESRVRLYSNNAGIDVLPFVFLNDLKRHENVKARLADYMGKKPGLPGP